MNVSVDIEGRRLVVDIALVGCVVEDRRVLLKKVCPNSYGQSAGEYGSSNQFETETRLPIETNGTSNLFHDKVMAYL